MRVLLVGRHFWPHGTIDAAGHLIQLATGLHRAGVHVEVATPRYSNRWAHHFVFREFRVHRPVVIAKNDWGANRYLKQLTQWLQSHGGSFDAMLCEGACEESIAVVDAAKRLNCPSIIRLSGRGTASDLNHWSASRLGRRCELAAKAADQIIVSCRSQHLTLVAAGFDPDKLTRIAPGVASASTWNDQSRLTRREQTRYALAAINSDLFAAPETPVALCIGPMRAKNGMEFVVQRAMQIVNRIPQLSLWLVGDGPRRDAIHKRLKSDGLRQAVAIPGSFGTTEDLFSAADLYIQPSDDGMDYLLNAAIGAGLPLAIGDSPATREFFTETLRSPSESTRSSGLEHDEDAFWFSKTQNKGLRGAVETIVNDLSSAQKKSESLRSRMQRSGPLNQSIAKTIELVDRLRKSSSASGTRPPNESNDASAEANG